MRGTTFEVGVTLVVEECCNCHVAFAMTQEFKARKQDTHQDFYCPNGHAQHYLAETEAEKLRKQHRSAQDDRDWYKEAEARQSIERAVAERSLAATKGVVTKMRKRAIAGACQFCHRHFSNVERHIASQHPEEKPDG